MTWLWLGASLVPLGWVAAARILWRYGERRLPEDHEADVIVVLGAAVWPDQEPSPTLRRRTIQAVALYEAGHAPRICLTGGVGEHLPEEAVIAARVARQEGVPDEALVIESASTNTKENAAFSAQLLGGDQRVIMVTDPYHVWRSERVFRRHFADARGVGAEMDWRWRLALREVVAAVWYGLRRRL